MASAARSSVGCRSGAKDGEWLPGAFSLSVFQHTDGADFADLHVRELQRVQPRADFRGCLQLLQRQLGMLVKPHVQCFARLARGGQRSNELSKSRFHRDSVYGVAWAVGDRWGGGVRR